MATTTAGPFDVTLTPDPTIAPLGSHLTLTTYLHNPGTLPVPCTGITVTLPVGKGETDLCEAADDVNANGWGEKSKSWTMSRQDGRFTFAPPDHRHQVVLPNEKITITLRGIPVNEHMGTAPVRVAVTQPTGSPPPYTCLVAKGSAEYGFGGLYPKNPMIPAGTHAELVWTAHDLPEGSKLELAWSTDQGPGTATLGPTQEYDSILLYRSTDVLLTATIPTGSPTPLTARDATLVTVAYPDLAVGDIEVGDRVTLLGPAPVTRYNIVPNQHPPTVTTLSAPGDGVLAVYLDTDAPTTPPATVLELLRPGAADHYWRTRITSRSCDFTHNVMTAPGAMLPVPADTTLRFTDVTDTPTDDYTLRLVWHSFGTTVLSSPHGALAAAPVN
jgi:hypothetical protein